MARWTVEAGRYLVFEGRPFVHLDKEGTDTRPVEADGAVILIADLFNQNGVTPDTIYAQHMGHPRKGRAREVNERGYLMTYGELPPFEKFERDIHTRPDPEHDGQPYWPKGTTYPMELVGAHEVQLANDFGGFKQFETERRRSGRNSGAIGFRGDERAVYEFLEYLVECMNDGDEEAGDLASSIMTTLGYEWI